MLNIKDSAKNTLNIENSIKEIFLTPKEVLHFYKISLTSQVSLRKKGLPHYKIGKLIRYNKNELNSWLENQKIC
ncbi:helix-turn-helix domain-containing protein [Campylobacter helveticus]|uniref:helix-turn-helix domain-containing protein n=1 Tax=Campylobacter helveticus TaxID=28898 RepID=UPI0022EB4937|nr:helix-turn-helix domain-containing protein [Campylobacter helveticus]